MIAKTSLSIALLAPREPMICRRSRLPTILGAASVLLLAGCKDVPTMPEAIQLLAGGEDWVAVSTPADLPQLDTWQRYLNGDQRAPDAATLQRALFALDFWHDRVSSQKSLARSPGIAATLEAVKAGRESAMQQLAAGDTSAAVRTIGLLTSRVHEHSPEAVALRVLARAEAHVDREMTEAGSERAMHLLATARHELVNGDSRRALRRALYALQILEGNEVRAVTTGADSACAGPYC